MWLIWSNTFGNDFDKESSLNEFDSADLFWLYPVDQVIEFGQLG